MEQRPGGLEERDGSKSVHFEAVAQVVETGGVRRREILGSADIRDDGGEVVGVVRGEGGEEGIGLEVVGVDYQVAICADREGGQLRDICAWAGTGDHCRIRP